MLNLSMVCPAPTRTGAKPYGFDGTTLQFADTSDESDVDGHSPTCEFIESYERR